MHGKLFIIFFMAAKYHTIKPKQCCYEGDCYAGYGEASCLIRFSNNCFQQEEADVLQNFEPCLTKQNRLTSNSFQDYPWIVWYNLMVESLYIYI